MKAMSVYIRVMVVVLVASASLASCTDDDSEQAYDMNGIWEGTITGNYDADRYHGDNQWDTEIQFVQDGDFARGGYGTEVDYNYSTRQVVRSNFNWEVRNGRILMDYDDGYRIVIRDYELYSVGRGQRFRGYFEDWDTHESIASFNLVKKSDWADWDA